MPRGKMMAPPPPLMAKPKTTNPTPSSSLVFIFDELMRNSQVLTQSCEDKFLTFLQNEEESIKQMKQLHKENERLNNELHNSINEAQRLEQKLQLARNLLAEENSRARKAEHEKQVLSDKFDMVRDLLTAEHGQTLNNETRQKLQRLEASVSSLREARNIVMSPGGALELSVVNEVNSTGSILDVSQLSVDQTCDPTLDESRTRSGRSFKRKSSDHMSKRRSKKSSRGSAGLILETSAINQERSAMTTAAMARRSLEKIAARRSLRKSQQKYNERNIDEFVPSAPPCEKDNADRCWQEAHLDSPHQNGEMMTPKVATVQRSHSNAGINSRRHMFDQKKVYNFETCGPCGNKLKWGRTAFKCRDCKAIAHPECKEQVPLPCISVGSATKTPSGKGHVLALADFTPQHTPMVPALLVHCVNEIEKRGLTEVGLYRVPGSEKDVRELKDRFLRGKGCPNLSKVDDIHILCGCIKDFLKSLKEPLIPHSQWSDLVQASSKSDPSDAEMSLVEVISKLPPPNHDTLAFMIMHFKRVSEVVENKMTITNLAKILSPTVIGYSSINLEPATMFLELPQMTAAMEKLLQIESDYWQRYLDVDDNLYNIRNTPASPLTPDIFKPRGSGLTPRNRGYPNYPTHHTTSSSKPMFADPMLV